MNQNNLQHTGVKGMKWGVRRASNQYKKLSDKADKNVSKTSSDRYIKAYNKTADEYNNGKIDAFNKTHSSKSSKYMDQYLEVFDKDLAKNYNKMLFNDIKNNKSYIKAQQISKKYNLESVDQFVKDNEKSVNDIKKLFE